MDMYNNYLPRPEDKEAKEEGEYLAKRVTGEPKEAFRVPLRVAYRRAQREVSRNTSMEDALRKAGKI